MQEEAIESLINDWQLKADNGFTEAAILEALEARVSVLLSRSADDFFQLMYRLDIAEDKLHTALDSENVPAALAKLIWQRQLEKIESRARYSGPLPPDSDLKW